MIKNCASDWQSLKSADRLKIRKDFSMEYWNLCGRIKVTSPGQVLIKVIPRTLTSKIRSIDCYLLYLDHCVYVFVTFETSRREAPLSLTLRQRFFSSNQAFTLFISCCISSLYFEGRRLWCGRAWLYRLHTGGSYFFRLMKLFWRIDWTKLVPECFLVEHQSQSVAF